MRVSDGFQIADSTNLPKVDNLMFLEYMIENDCYNKAEAQIAKKLVASRADYVDTAVGYVEIRRKWNVSTVKCRIAPEHNVKEILFIVTAIINESAEKIVKMECNNCESSAGGCKHAICFTLWLIKRSEEPKTSTICYWDKPKQAEDIAGQEFLMAKNLGRRRSTSHNVESNNSIINDFIEECKKRKITTQLNLKYCGNGNPEFNDSSE